jgi:hypothetical protein
MKGILEKMRDGEPIFPPRLIQHTKREIVFFTSIQGLEQFEKAMILWKNK